MSDIALTQPMTDAAYEAIADQLLQDMRVMNKQIERNHTEIERIKQETARLQSESMTLSANNYALLDRLKATR